MTTVRAAQLDRPDGPSGLVVRQVAQPVPGPATAPLAGAAPLLEALEQRRLAGKAVLEIRSDH